ncbi:hypothetical protein BRARA_H00298 [Brassica rapa]|uniref:Cathepsin propeptide inhibitor domain-containing protein n=1 Tax=Brassica campestris TaxID=3711 RepID=A0A397Y7E1_BRACM|nr:hypothetical protein BRARA_H00298 [Brassica rapa]
MVSVLSVFVALTIISINLMTFQASYNVTLNEKSISDYYQKWMIQFSKVYKDNFEKEMRFKVFKKNLIFIENFNNMGNQSYKLGVNEFTDMTKEEFLATYTGRLRGINITSLPKVVDQSMSSRKLNFSELFYALLDSVLRQPISVDIDSIVLVGYGVTDDGIMYWLAKNSWGENWGEQGYMRIRRMVEWPEGMCGLSQYANYPVV